MYAIVHKAAEDCSRVLKETGFEVLVVEPPVKQAEIRGEALRKGIHKEWCCGADEFIKLFAYSLPEDIVVQYVHWRLAVVCCRCISPNSFFNQR